jgi:tetratricopeptide (TPR) repeat protein
MPGVMAASLFVAMLLAAPGAPAEPPPKPPLAETLQTFEERATARLAKARTGRCPEARADLLNLVKTDGFDRLDELLRRNVLLVVLACTSVSDDPDTLLAARTLEPLANTDQEFGWIHYHLMRSELRKGGDRRAAAWHLVEVLDGRPQLLRDWEAHWLGPMLVAAKDDPELEMAVLGRLVTVDWTSPSARYAARGRWRVSLAQLQTTRSTPAALRDNLEQVTDPDSLVSVALDRRFESEWPDLEATGRFDWRALAEADLAAKRKAFADEPDRLEHAMYLMAALRRSGAAQEAEAIGRAARAKLTTPDTFVDQEENAPWLLLALIDTLEDQGRYDEVDALYREVMPISDKSGDRISQRVNWSGHLINAGRPAEALKVLEEIGDDSGSPYGIAWRDSGMVCALADSDRPRAQALLNKMVPAWDSNPAAVQEAHLCLGQIDEAAALMVKRLESPKHRDGAIGVNLKGPPGKAPKLPFAARLKAARDQVYARPEVVQALARYSRPVVVPYLGDYAEP